MRIIDHPTARPVERDQRVAPHPRAQQRDRPLGDPPSIGASTPRPRKPWLACASARVRKSGTVAVLSRGWRLQGTQRIRLHPSFFKHSTHSPRLSRGLVSQDFRWFSGKAAARPNAVPTPCTEPWLPRAPSTGPGETRPGRSGSPCLHGASCAMRPGMPDDLRTAKPPLPPRALPLADASDAALLSTRPHRRHAMPCCARGSPAPEAPHAPGPDRLRPSLRLCSSPLRHGVGGARGLERAGTATPHARLSADLKAALRANEMGLATEAGPAAVARRARRDHPRQPRGGGAPR
jgi:hypothetical protein